MINVFFIFNNYIISREVVYNGNVLRFWKCRKVYINIGENEAKKVNLKKHSLVFGCILLLYYIIAKDN